MPNFQIQSLEVVASYHQLDRTFAMRPSPQYISWLAHKQVARTIDFERVVHELKDRTYTGVDALDAIKPARMDVMDKMLAYSQDDSLAADQVPYYRKTSTGSHETVFYLVIREKDGALKPVEFKVEDNGKTYEGYVCISLIVVQAADSSHGADTGIHGTMSADRVVPGAHSPTGIPAPARHEPATGHVHR